jgi:pyruvate,water dikinase
MHALRAPEAVVSHLSLVTAASTPQFARRELGGKGWNLYLMSRAGLPVPPWVGVAARAFRVFRDRTGIGPKIDAALAGTGGEPARLAAASVAIRELILAEPLSKEERAAVEAAFSALGGGAIAVRSSALGEDSSQQSFAGQLSSFLHVESAADAARFLQECWASAYSERSLSYRLQSGLGLGHAFEVGVVFQQMLSCDKSGVAFTIDPVRSRADVMTVSAVWGLGEGLVSGLLDADTYQLAKADGKLLEQDIVEKDSMLVRGGSGATRETAVPQERQKEPVLTSGDLLELATMLREVERHYGRPQDVEWGYAGGKLYLLQTRPVTTLSKNLDGALLIWDNSNIVESYGGITLPLTFSFARYVYREVYVQLCDILLVPPDEIQQMEHNLRNMLGLIHGRVYYNLLNWYRLLTIVPGFKQNRSFMETMMGVRESLADEVAARCMPPSPRHPTWRRVLRFVSGIKLFYYHATAQRLVDRFLQYFHAVYDEFRRIDYARMPADRIYEHFRGLEDRLLRRWHAPIVNDMLCMIHFGVVKKLCAKWFPAEGASLQNDLLCGEGNLESAEPTRELIRMAALVKDEPALKKLIEETPAGDCLEAVMRSPHAAFRQRVASYIDRFGFRCMSEMKLEQRDLHDEPAFLFVCLKNYLTAGKYDLEAYEANERAIRTYAEETARKLLSPVRRAVFFWFLRHARRAVKNRENTRFCRTRVYGVVRTMLFAWGDDYASRGLIDKAADVFYLTMEELHGSLDGTLAVQDLRQLIDMRKRAYAEHEKAEPAPRFLTRGPVYWMNDHAPADEASAVDLSQLLPNQLKGIGCCPGVITGKVKVILNPGDDMQLNGEILVTARTDPGWVPLYPACSGLLVERGSLLSHSAIVAREMGLPTVVSVKGLTKRLTTGMTVRFDGATGLIEILE